TATCRVELHTSRQNRPSLASVPVGTEFELRADKEEHVSEIMKTGTNNIDIGKVKRLVLVNYAINILPNLELEQDNEVEELVLFSSGNRNMEQIMSTETNNINIGIVKKLVLRKYAINILPKLKLARRKELEELNIADVDRECCSETTFSSGSGFFSWKIRKLKIENSEICVLRIRNEKSCVLDSLEFIPQEKEKINRLKIRHLLSPIWIGQIKQSGFSFPEEIKQCLEYTLVDEEGNPNTDERVTQIRRRGKTFLAVFVLVKRLLFLLGKMLGLGLGLGVF
ncbi:MAG: uncharacterized protein A8A55_3207, partial [Amphiamblys sp. WSBS2006]